MRNHSNSSDRHQVRSSKKATPQKTSTTCPTAISDVSNKHSRDMGNTTEPQRNNSRSSQPRQTGCLLSADVSSKGNSPPEKIKIYSEAQFEFEVLIKLQ
jgi:hypothetical protein